MAPVTLPRLDGFGGPDHAARGYRHVVPSPREITTFDDDGPPPGESPRVAGLPPSPLVAPVEPDPAWPQQFVELEARLRAALGARVLQLEHIGSTSVPGLAAKPVIDIDLVVADPADETAYVPALEAAGFVLHIREPWCWEHRVLKSTDPVCHVHVLGPESPIPWRDRIFRDHLRRNPADRELYARTKRAAWRASAEAGENAVQYNRRKQGVLRDIHRRAFEAAGLLGR